MEAFIDTNCVISHEGKQYGNGGGLIAQRADNGKYIAFLYADDVKRRVTNWHGDKQFPAYFGREYHSNMGDKRRSVWFTATIDGKSRNFHGIWCSIDWNQLVRFKEIKS